MVDYVSSIVVDEVIDALKAFMVVFVPVGAKIVRGQVNRVALPSNPCVVLTEMMQSDISVASMFNGGITEQVSILSPTKITVQIDFYGAAAGDYCNAFKSAYRTPYACANFPANIQPLFLSDPMQAPLITGEQQYESRWTVTASMQYNPVVTLPQQSAIAVEAIVHIPVDTLDEVP